METKMKWRMSRDGGDVVEILDNRGQIIGTAIDAEQAQIWIAAPDLLGVAQALTAGRHTIGEACAMAAAALAKADGK